MAKIKLDHPRGFVPRGRPKEGESCATSPWVSPIALSRGLLQGINLKIILFVFLIIGSSVFAESAPTSSTSPPISSDQFREWLNSNDNKQFPAANEMSTGRVPSASMNYEQGQQAMLNAIPGTPPSQDAIIAFNSMLQQNMPLSPQQVVQLRQQIDLAQRASATSPNIPPKPVSTTLMINLAPGATPPAIRLAQGYVTSLVFVDSTGAPWPIASFDIGSPKSMNIQWDGKSNILLLQAVSPYSNGNIVVKLIGMPIPITLELVAGQPVVDYRADIHVSGIGPNTKEVPIGIMLPNSANQLLLGVLDGVAPAGSKALTVRGADAQAWLLGDKMYFRTRFTVLSPGWIGTMASPDGMHAYEMPKTSSVLVSRYGEPAELKIEGL
ncbi:MAG TPA: DotH/IcmK family type IV secretion protein [Gammaproteobacteria bacterium]|nr:DotH/IcmK family type IV secretion protein [Gammaproteobacteria bacterium]